nr:putative reverse transcriptase domain-containing protein [Tanacetum cinerariifolium]
MSSSPSHATVTYTSMSIVDDVPYGAQPLLASASPTALSPDYSTDFEPAKEDLEEDLKEESFEEEEEELSTLVDSLPARLYIDLPSKLDYTLTYHLSWVAAAEPPLSSLSSLLTKILSPPLLLLLLNHRDIILEADMPLRKRTRFAAPSHRTPRMIELYYEIMYHPLRGRDDIIVLWILLQKPGKMQEILSVMMDQQTVIVVIRLVLVILAILYSLLSFMGNSQLKMTSTRTSTSQEALEELISQHVADALATYDTNWSNGDDSHDLGSGGRRTMNVRHDAAYEMPWNTLMKMMVENYCSRSEKKKMETELQAENKSKMDNNLRNNHGQQTPYKRHNVARAYAVGSGEKREYAGTLPLYNKCKFHHNRLCAAKNASGNIEVYGRTYALGGGEPNPDSNVVTGCHVFLARITKKKTEDKSEEKRRENVPVVCDFPKVFPEDFLGIPPTRQLEFQIALVHGAAPVAQAPYQLAPSKMKGLSDQLQELFDKGFIRPSSSPKELWFCLSRRRMDRFECVSTTASRTS